MMDWRAEDTAAAFSPPVARFVITTGESQLIRRYRNPDRPSRVQTVR
jgi:hypothetical protein